MTAIKLPDAGCYGVRYASDRDHQDCGWIFRDCYSERSAVDAADMYLKERSLDGVMLHVVDDAGEVVEWVTREIEE